MNPSKLFLTLGAAAALSFPAEAAISVTGAGAGPFDFAVAPASPADFSTRTVGNNANNIETVAALDAAVMTNDASTVATALGSIPAPGTAQLAQHINTNTIQALYTRPTGIDYNLLMATLVNNAGTPIYGFRLTYDYGIQNTPGVETIPGHRVFFSTTGAPGSWLAVPALSGLAAATPGATAFITGFNWPAGGNAYILWADDNDLGNPDAANTIDNLAITEVDTTVDPTTISITSPASGFSVAVCADITVTTLATGLITNVVFMVDGVPLTNDTSLPYGGTFTVPLSTPVGNHTLTAVAMDSNGGMATSLPVMVTVLANTPPMLSITNTFSGTVTGTTFLVGSAITVQHSFSDDDVITNISWYVNNALYITNRINSVTPWIYANSLAGTYELKGIASDRKGNMTTATRMITVTNPPAGLYTLLVTNGSSWRYFIQPATPGEPPPQVVLWNSAYYDDSTIDWADGFAELGNGDLADGYPEKTMIDLGPAATRHSAMYFRKVFTVADPNAFDNLVIRLLRDDGAVVYLNQDVIDETTFELIGGPIWTNNMTVAALPVPYAALANNAGDDGLTYQVLNLPNPPGKRVLVAGQNTIAVEVHQTTATSSDLSFDLMVWGTSIPNQLPTCTLTNPPAGSNLMVGTFVLVGASASDPDGGVSRVEFYDNGVLRLSDTTSPYDFTLGDLTAGAHTISAFAVDSSGATGAVSSVMIMVTNPPALLSLLTNGAAWKYLDDGTDQGTAWHALGFNDSGWSNGIADLGYGDGPGVPERTVVGFGPIATNKFITTYFRKTISVANPGEIGSVRLDALRDDGIVVYINGTEVFRDHFMNTTTPIQYRDLADGAGGAITGNAESTYITANISSSALVAGLNIIAAEIHQDGTNSSDISFDLMLWGTGPLLRISHVGANAVVQWNNTPNYHLEQSSNIGSPLNWAPVAGNPQSPFTTPLPAAPSQRFYRLRHN